MPFPRAKLKSKLHFQIELCFVSLSLHLKRGNISHIWSFSLCLQAIIVKMQIAAKYGADIISSSFLSQRSLVSFPISLLPFLLPIDLFLLETAFTHLLSAGFSLIPQSLYLLFYNLSACCWTLSTSSIPSYSFLPEPNIY